METLSFTGKCPQCELYNEASYMGENDKNWECPSCNLQILIEQNNASIFRHRGNGNFKHSVNKFKGDIPYQEVGIDSYPNGTAITTREQLLKYLLLQVDQKPKYSIDRLIDVYENYKFKGESIDDYLEQSFHFRIDFDNEEMVEILQLRDKKQQLSNHYSTWRLYYFLVNNIFPKYHNSDNSCLPEMGMSKLEYYLCRKHFQDHQKDIINSNPKFIRQALKALIIDLIAIIYNNEDVFLTGDLQEMIKIKQEKYDTNLN